jgi:hypothetical protein
MMIVPASARARKLGSGWKIFMALSIHAIFF